MDTKEGTGRPVPKLTRENMDKKRKRVQRAPTANQVPADFVEGVRLQSGHKDAGSKSMPKLVVHKLMPGQLERNAVALTWRNSSVNKFRGIVCGVTKRALFYGSECWCQSPPPMIPTSVWSRGASNSSR